MSTTAVGAQRFDARTLLHPRGFCISASFSCAVCGKLLQAWRLNIRQGIQKCSTCGTLFKVGINLFIIPQGPGQSKRIAPDESLPPKDRALDAIRRRTREQRVLALRELGLDDTVPPVALQPFLGQEINSVTVVAPPESEPEPRT